MHPKAITQILINVGIIKKERKPVYYYNVSGAIVEHIRFY